MDASAQPLSAGEYVCISIIDTGIGMDEVTLKRAAKPFFTTKGVAKGTGLGLSMVYGLAAQSDGWIRMSSQPGHGTTVELFFPLSESNPSVEPAMPIVLGTGYAGPSEGTDLQLPRLSKPYRQDDLRSLIASIFSTK